MDRIAFIGPKILSQMLKLQGFDTYSCKEESEVRSALLEVFALKRHHLVFLTEELALSLPDLDRILNNPEINVMIIPDNRETSGVMLERIDHLIKNALGGEVK